MLKYSDFRNVEEFNRFYGITTTINEDRNKEEKIRRVDSADELTGKKKVEVIYADQNPKEYKNIFKHIVVFTNDRDPKGNKTLKNIEEAIAKLKKSKSAEIPELHVFVAAKMTADESEENIVIKDDQEELTISNQSNLDTLIFSRLGVQGEDQCEHIVKVLQDRGFLVLNPVQYSALACDKYQSALLFKKGNIPQPNFTLMTKDILKDEKKYNESMKEVYPEWDSKDNDKNEKLMFVIKILDGHGGTGVALIDGKKILALLQLVFAIDPEQKLLIQKKEEADGGDIRVHVLTLRDKQVILAQMKRVKLGGDFRSNVSLGASAEAVKLTPEQEQIALRTAALSKLPWCAVDIMPLVKGSNPKVGDNVVLEINASPGTDGISDVMEENFINILLNELDDPSQFVLQDKTAGYIESVKIKFSDDVEKELLAKLDTGNSTKASSIEVGEFEEKGNKITFSIDGKEMTFDKVDTSFAHAGGDRYERPIIVIPEITLGLRKLKDVKVAIVKSREKNTNVLLNRDVLSKLGYVVHPDHLHLLTKEMEKVKII